MELNSNQINLEDDIAAKFLIRMLEDNQIELSLSSAYVYHNFPLYRDEEDAKACANVLILSKHHGVVLFECSNLSAKNLKNAIGKIEEQLEQTYSHIYSKLIKSKLLRACKRNEIVTPIATILYLPNADTQTTKGTDYIVKDFASLQESLLNIILEKELADNFFKEMVSIIEGAKGIVRPKERNIIDANKQWKGALLQKVEGDISTFDMDQKIAALNIIKGPQRIRGLAGSGKTIILTWKAALIHLQNPNAEIIYTFYTKSLYQLIKQLITRFFRQYADTDPNWSKIKILHGWGGQSMPGVYYDICQSNGIMPLTFQEAKSLGANPFDEVCKNLMKEKLKQECDFILVDEAQDFPPSFYRLSYMITKNSSVIWGYDECQNILNTEIQDTKKTFGLDEKMKPLVDLSLAAEGTRNDIVLHKCYRNPRNVLNIAFSLGFGLYNERILQMLENNEHWEDLGFKVLKGKSEKGSYMEVERLRQNSPTITDDQFPKHQNIVLKVCTDTIDECEFVCKAIKKDIEEGLRPDDILVVSIDDVYTKTYFGRIEQILNTEGIETFNLQTAPYNTKMFKFENMITLSTVYKAKGNESASVYIMGFDNAARTSNSINTRNKIFTAITRSKCWVTITASSEAAQPLMNEIDKTLKDFPLYKFTMPDKDVLKKYQRDHSDSQAEMRKMETQIEQIAKKRGISVYELLKEFDKKR